MTTGTTGNVTVIEAAAMDLSVLPLDVALEMYRDYHVELAPARAMVEALGEMEKTLKNRIREEGAPAVDGVKITVRRGGERTRWNGSGLEGYMVAHPEIAAFRSTYNASDSVGIQVVE